MRTSPEIRFRIDQQEREQFEQVARRLGMDMNDMVKVFIRRSIAAGGFPFEMRLPAAQPAPVEQRLPALEQLPPVHGVSVAYLAEVAQRAAQTAYEEHAKAGRLPTVPAATDPNSMR